MDVATMGMPKTLTNADIIAFLQSNRDSDTLPHITQDEQCIALPVQFGSGYIRRHLLQPGLILDIADVELNYNHVNRIQVHSPQMPLTASFYLSGQAVVTNEALPTPQTEQAGNNYLYHLPQTAEIEKYHANQRIYCLKLYFELDHFPQLNLQHLAAQSSNLSQPIHTPYPLYCKNPTTPRMHLVLEQLVTCPFQGMARNVYLAGKALELLGLQLEALSTSALPSSLHPTDVEQIHKARHILIQNYLHPPSLLELARQVGINDRKLKQGFRYVFGTSVFNYLYQYRMDKARQLLTSGQWTVTETAHAVGYASRTAFVAAFTKQFKVNPNTYRP
ncbi:AraC family transcriptional regulator [Acaryochloris marina]|uniref:helix-turn-helix transcriptional regulator n=1 Tax=Acaryochloris marina TaxID=155978 RepID=UPI002017B1AE|nr:AraC family transcriptional regulator [Acaryochloris marina]